VLSCPELRQSLLKREIASFVSVLATIVALNWIEFNLAVVISR
jgi:hypothetical protein